jgi:hypothetical protein
MLIAGLGRSWEKMKRRDKYGKVWEWELDAFMKKAQDGIGISE